jgi:signal transduction histidine kinase
MPNGVTARRYPVPTPAGVGTLANASARPTTCGVSPTYRSGVTTDPHRTGQRGPGRRRDWPRSWRGLRQRDWLGSWPGPRQRQPGPRQRRPGPQDAWCPSPGPGSHHDVRAGGTQPAWFGGYRLAAVVTAITLGTTFAWHAHHAGIGARQVDPAGWALLLVVSAALTLRLRYPAATLAIAGAGTAAYFGLGNPAGTVFLPLTIALGGAILAGYRLLAWLSAPVVYAFIVWGPHYLARAGPAPSLSEAVSDAAWPLLILIGAEMLRAGRERAASMARGRAEHQRRQAEQARRQASEERVRIAQELHDVVAHNISLINVQAGVALHLMDSDGGQSPEQARTALTAIKQASKETLGELRSVLGILRAEPGEHAPLSPAAGLDQLDGLIAGATSAGLSVQTEATGDRVPLPPSADLAAYRIVQEALTNVIKHVGGAEVIVRLRYGETGLHIEVTDDGTAPTGTAPTDGTVAGPSGTGGARGGEPGGEDEDTVGEGGDIGGEGGGSGIPGMRERTRMLGGEFSAGPLPSGGFRVAAVLPLRRYDPAAADAPAEAGTVNAGHAPEQAAEAGTGGAAASGAPATGRDGAA